MTDEKPRVARSLKEEAHEILTVLELKDAPREAKMGAERDLYRGAGEAELAEKSFHRRRHESLDEIRNTVDAMGPREPERVAPVEPPAPPAPQPPAPEPERAQEPPAPEPSPAPTERAGRASRPITDDERALLARLLPGDLLDVAIVYESQTGRVVEARYEMGDGKRGASLFALREGQVRDLTDIEAHADSLRPRAALKPADAEERASPASAWEPPAADERERTPDAAPAPPPERLEPLAQPPAAEPAKKGLFGRRGRKEKTVEPTTEAPAEAKIEKKSRFSFGRGKEDPTPEPAGSTAPPDATVPAEGKRKFGLPFRKKGS